MAGTKRTKKTKTAKASRARTKGKRAPKGGKGFATVVTAVGGVGGLLSIIKNSLDLRDRFARRRGKTSGVAKPKPRRRRVKRGRPAPKR